MKGGDFLSPQKTNSSVTLNFKHLKYSGNSFVLLIHVKAIHWDKVVHLTDYSV